MPTLVRPTRPQICPARGAHPPRADAAQLRERAHLILDGDPSAVRWLLEEVKPQVLAFLFSQCWDSRSHRLVDEIVGDLFAECFGGFDCKANGRVREPLLLRYHGDASLSTWLKRVARNRLVSRTRSLEERNRVFPGKGDRHGDDSPLDLLVERAAHTEPAVMRMTTECPESHPLGAALIYALERAECDSREDLVLLKLHYLHNIPKNRLATAWEVEPSTIGRRIDRVLKQIRQQTRSGIPFSAKSPHYGTEDFLEAGCGAVIGSHRIEAHKTRSNKEGKAQS